MELTTEQKAVVDAALKAIQDGQRVFCYSGPGGTGKTVVAAQICKDAIKRGFIPIACAITGKAASRFQQALAALGVNIQAVTTSKLCERVIETDDGPKFLPKKGTLPDNAFLIVDEFSMIGDNYLRTKLGPATVGYTIIGGGDHVQLPPVMDKDNPYLVRTRFRLTQIHRQADKSGIKALARAFRNDAVSVYYKEGDTKKSIFDFSSPEVVIVPCVSLQASVLATFHSLDHVVSPVLVGTNEIRTSLNKLVRARFGLEGSPQAKETLRIERNNHEMNLFNGDQVKVVKILAQEDIDGFIASRALIEGAALEEPTEVFLPHTEEALAAWSGETRCLAWDFGYATTIHKSQGSEWPHVRVVIDEHLASISTGELGKRTLYTAVTRASKRLDIFVVDYAYNRARAKIKNRAQSRARSRNRPRSGTKPHKKKITRSRVKDLYNGSY